MPPPLDIVNLTNACPNFDSLCFLQQLLFVLASKVDILPENLFVTFLNNPFSKKGHALVNSTIFLQRFAV